MKLHHLGTKEYLSFVHSSLVFSGSVPLPHSEQEGKGKTGPREDCSSSEPGTYLHPKHIPEVLSQGRKTSTLSLLVSESAFGFFLDHLRERDYPPLNSQGGLPLLWPSPHNLGIYLQEKPKLWHTTKYSWGKEEQVGEIPGFLSGLSQQSIGVCLTAQNVGLFEDTKVWRCVVGYCLNLLVE